MHGVEVVVHIIKGNRGCLSKCFAIGKRDISVDGVTTSRPCEAVIEDGFVGVPFVWSFDRPDISVPERVVKVVFSESTDISCSIYVKIVTPLSLIEVDIAGIISILITNPVVNLE